MSVNMVGEKVVNVESSMGGDSVKLLLDDCHLYEEQVLRLVLNMQIGGVCA
jgi:hypothetical protein